MHILFLYILFNTFLILIMHSATSGVEVCKIQNCFQYCNIAVPQSPANYENPSSRSVEVYSEDKVKDKVQVFASLLKLALRISLRPLSHGRKKRRLAPSRNMPSGR